MKTDRELLELAAKAAKIEHKIKNVTPCYRGDPNFDSLVRQRHYSRKSDWAVWNPLTDSGDALRLAVKLRKFPVIENWSDGNWVYIYGHESCAEPLGTDPYAATRRAIVRAAAAIGEQMK